MIKPWILGYAFFRQSYISHIHPYPILPAGDIVDFFVMALYSLIGEDDGRGLYDVEMSLSHSPEFG